MECTNEKNDLLFIGKDLSICIEGHGMTKFLRILQPIPIPSTRRGKIFY